MRKGLLLLLAASTVLASMSISYGQVERGTISGTVRDTSGAVVPNATVTITNTATGVTFKTRTTGAGQYVAPNLIPGNYSVTASFSGFATVVRSGISLHIDELLQIDLQLRVGTTTQQVQVTAASPLVQNESSTVSTLISRQSIAELPLNGRSVFQVGPLVAGVTNGIPQSNANNTSIPDNARAAQGLSVNGQVQSTNSYILDGVYNDQINQGLMAVIPPLEAIQELTLETSNFRPEVGRGGGVMNITLKSGSNNFHGELFEFLRNSALDARNFFDYSSPERLPNLVQNQYGGTFGGPIRRDKTFFFFDYQGFRQREGETYVTTVPDAAIRSGDFAGTAFPIYDPATFNASTSTRQPFPGQTISPSRFSPAAVKILNFIPLPNGPVLNSGAGLFYSSASRQSNQYNYDIKIDSTFSDHDSLTGRWSEGQSHTLLPGSFSSIPADAPAVGESVTTGGAGGLTGRVSNPSESLGLGEIHNFSPRLINEARAAFVRTGANSVQLGYGHNYANQLGIPNVNVTNNNSGFPTMNISGLSTIGETPFFPLVEVENVFEYLDNVTFISGAHTFKSGVDFKKVERQFTQILGDPAGGFDFGGTFTDSPANPGSTGNAVADFLLGIPDDANLIRNSGEAGLRSTEFSAYWQDTWRATSKLTADYGIRYDLFTPQTEVYNRQTNFDLVTARLLLPPGTGSSDQNFHNRALMRTNELNFSPRLGLAYSPSHRTVIRTAYGVFYFPQAMEGDQMTLNPPFVGGTNYVNTGVPQQINRTLDQGLPTTNPFIPINQFTGTIIAYDPDNRTAYSQQWTFGIQRQITANTLLEGDYVGSKTTHLEDEFDPNAPLPGNGPVLSRQRFGPAVGRVFDFVYWENRANANYNALQITLRRNFSRGLTLLADYTWSHDLGDVRGGTFNGGGSHQNIHNLEADYGNMGQDARHRFVASWLYQLPLGRGKAWLSGSSGLVNALAGGWQVGGVTDIQTGEPYTVTGGAGLPNRICNGNAPPGGHTIQQWFNPNCFPLPSPVPDLVYGGSYIPYGDSGTNVLFGPGLVNFDLSAFKSFSISEDKRLEFRSEFFNAFNQPHFGLPTAGVPCCNPGLITSAGPAREIQMALRFFF